MANKNNPKKLTLSAVKEQAKRTDEIIKIDFNEYDGTYFQVKLRPFFNNVGKTRIIETLSQDIKAMQDKAIIFPDNTLPDYLIFLAVLEFSDFPRPKTDDIQKKIAYFYQVIETKYFRDMTEMMIDEEIQEIWLKIMQTVEMNEKLQSTINQNQALMQSIQEKNGLNGTKTDAE